MTIAMTAPTLSTKQSSFSNAPAQPNASENSYGRELKLRQSASRELVRQLYSVVSRSSGRDALITAANPATPALPRNDSKSFRGGGGYQVNLDTICIRCQSDRVSVFEIVDLTMAPNLSYPKQVHSTVNRYSARGNYDLQAVHAIVNNTPVLHVSFATTTEEPFPAILPMIGQMGSFEFPSAGLDEPLDCYLHGYVSSRIVRLASENAVAGQGLPICVAATKVDGLVLSLTPNSHSYNYRSAVLHGYASLVTSDEEKLWAMKLITNSVVPQRWEHTRTPPDNAEMSSTRILRVRVVSGSAKTRQGGPHDEKKDTENEQTVGQVWVGTVPCWDTFGAPNPAPSKEVQPIPGYITEFLKSRSESNEQDAMDAMKEDLE